MPHPGSWRTSADGASCSTGAFPDSPTPMRTVDPTLTGAAVLIGAEPTPPALKAGMSVGRTPVARPERHALQTFWMQNKDRPVCDASTGQVRGNPVIAFQPIMTPPCPNGIQILFRVIYPLSIQTDICIGSQNPELQIGFDTRDGL